MTVLALVPPPVPAPLPVGALLRRAAEDIQQYGLATGRFFDPETGAHDISGAIRNAAGLARGGSENAYAEAEHWPEVQRAERLVAAVLTEMTGIQAIDEPAETIAAVVDDGLLDADMAARLLVAVAGIADLLDAKEAVA